jgi:hypothetical protein
MVTHRGGRDLVKPYGPSAVKLPNKEFQLLMEDADILPGSFRNFSGRAGMYNAEGERSFCVKLDPEVAEDMAADGWNVKQLKEFEGEPGDFYISVNVKYRDRFGNDLTPPKLKIITSNGSQLLREDQAHWLDQVDIAKVDLIINGRTRIEDGQRKISAYLQTYFCTINEDYLEQKYSDIPEINDVNYTVETIQNPSELDKAGEVVEGELAD